MNFLAELETMAVNVTIEEDAITLEDTQRWQKLFGFATASEAFAAMEEYRQDFTRKRLDDDIWEAIMSEEEAEGHNRESYEYSLTLPQQAGATAMACSKGTFIVKLTGPLDTAAKIQEAASLDQTPLLVDGTGEFGDAQFCEIDTAARARLQSWVTKHHSGFRPTIVRLSKAKKELPSHTLAPMLGLECTLPQHRLNGDYDSPPVSATQYPVWYFFYDTLADPDVLSRHLGLEEGPEYFYATVCGGRIRTWAGKYKALVDAPGECVHGSAYLVKDAAEEDALRFYETDQYEVVRCRIVTADGGTVHEGLTFRYDGDMRQLDD